MLPALCTINKWQKPNNQSSNCLAILIETSHLWGFLETKYVGSLSYWCLPGGFVSEAPISSSAPIKFKSQVQLDGIFFLFHKTKTITNTNKQNVDSCSPDQPEVLMRVRVREGQGPLFSFFDHSVIKKRRKLMKMNHTNVIYCTHIR